MSRIHTDLSRVAISVAPSPATTGTSLGVTDANAAYLPDTYPYWAVLVPTGAAPTRANSEIVKVTGGSSSGGTTTLTITREQGIPATTAQTVTTSFDIYDANSAEANIGLNSLIINETPSGTVNGSNTAFDTAQTYVAGSIQVYRDGQLMKGGGEDYTETDSNTITFTTAPATGSVLLVTYQHTVSTTGNADTVDGYQASFFFQHPAGHLLNGKIVPSVSSNNLTVAIKTLAGADPSASDPVYVRIGDTIRSITSALSVTKNAGTNWCNAGGSELATYEQDYFVYLGYNATDGVVIGFSRYPMAQEYGGFSATTTDEKYCAISTITNAVSGDDYELIGRFAATLSAGAGYTWTVPTFSNINLIQRPIFKTRKLQFKPSWTGFSSAPTSVHNYQLINDRVYLSEGYDPGTSNSATLIMSLPWKGYWNGGYQYGQVATFDNGSWQSAMGVWGISTGSNSMSIGKTIGTYAANAFAGFTSSGTKGFQGQINYAIQ